METNNSNTSSYTTDINGNDVFSEESTYIEYSNIPDYTIAKYTNNYKTLSIQQFSIAFLNLLKQVYNEYKTYITYFRLVDAKGYHCEITEIYNNLDKFILWDGQYIINDNNIETNKLLSFNTLKNKISFKVSYRCKTKVSDRLIITSYGFGRPVITNDNVIENKIISVNDLNYSMDFPIDYFNIFECFENHISSGCADNECEIVECDFLDCVGYECDEDGCNPDMCVSHTCYGYNPNDCPYNECLEVDCEMVDCELVDCDEDGCDDHDCMWTDLSI